MDSGRAHAVMANIYTEYCDKATRKTACPLGALCLKAHRAEVPVLRRNPFANDVMYQSYYCENP